MSNEQDKTAITNNNSNTINNNQSTPNASTCMNQGKVYKDTVIAIEQDKIFFKILNYSKSMKFYKIYLTITTFLNWAFMVSIFVISYYHFKLLQCLACINLVITLLFTVVDLCFYKRSQCRSDKIFLFLIFKVLVSFVVFVGLEAWYYQNNTSSRDFKYKLQPNNK